MVTFLEVVALGVEEMERFFISICVPFKDIAQRGEKYR